jgi:hypothetical protein
MNGGSLAEPTLKNQLTHVEAFYQQAQSRPASIAGAGLRNAATRWTA